jgi:hypothetical protein
MAAGIQARTWLDRLNTHQCINGDKDAQRAALSHQFRILSWHRNAAGNSSVERRSERPPSFFDQLPGEGDIAANEGG